MLIDAHVHPSLFADPQQVYHKAAEAGILLVAMSCSLEDAKKVMALSAQYHTPALMGVHPWYAQSARFPQEFLGWLNHPQLWGIGECGLDFDSPLTLPEQQKLLEEQLLLADEHDLMVSLHVRKAHGELIRLLKKFRGRLRGMVHNFTFSKELARAYLDLNLMLSLGSHILQRTPKMCEVIRFVGPEHLLLETDSDGIHSGPYSPELLGQAYVALAEILKLKVEVVQEQLQVNFKTLAPR